MSVSYPNVPQPGPRPGPPPGGFRPGPPPQQSQARPVESEIRPLADGESTGHPAVDAVLGALANAAKLAPADQIAEYEAAHRVLQETLTSIDG
jgi:hypothetical protein